MKLTWTIRSFQGHHCLILKLIVPATLLIFFVYSTLKVSKGIRLSLEKSEEHIISLDPQDDTYPRLRSEGHCDLFVGDWIPKSSGPTYTNETCPFIESHQNCMLNGRPDSAYLYWGWKPRDCELSGFDAHKFLEMMRNKSWALVGDSISRNHMQSLICMLSKVEQAVEVYHSADYRSRRWHFPSYNTNVSVLFSPFLVHAAIFDDDNGVAPSEIEVHLDKLDKKWTALYSSLDYMIFATGKWFLRTAIYYENNIILGCHYCPKRNLTELGFDFAYRKALRYVFDHIVTSGHKGSIFFRTSTPEHFEFGEWYEGGKCNRTAPYKEGQFKPKLLHMILRKIELEEFEKAKVKASQTGVNLQLLDVAPLSLLRPDGHPGSYRYPHPSGNGNAPKMPEDCLHWCLPGPIDAWNDVIMKMLMNR